LIKSILQAIPANQTGKFIRKKAAFSIILSRKQKQILEGENGLHGLPMRYQ
jgi:hypothetical protein